MAVLRRGRTLQNALLADCADRVRVKRMHQAGHARSAQVKPVLALLKTTLMGSGVALLLSTVLLFSLIRSGSDADGVYGEPWRAGGATAVALSCP